MTVTGEDLWAHMLQQLRRDHVADLLEELQDVLHGEPQGECLAAIVQCLAFTMATMDADICRKMLAVLGDVLSDVIAIGKEREIGTPQGRA